MYDAGAVEDALIPEIAVEARAEPLEKLVNEGEREKMEKMLSVVKTEVGKLLEGRRDAEVQQMHIDDVYRNAVAIWRPQSEVEREMAELFAWSHDVGKWIPANEPVVNMGSEPSLQAKLGFGAFDGGLYRRFVEARQKYKDKPGYEVERDIAHHLIGAVWFVKKAEEMGFGESVFAKRIIDAIIDHQFGGYYSVVARKLEYSEGEVGGITKLITWRNEFARQMRVADLSAMAQVGRIEGNEVKIGGFLKLILISADIYPDDPPKKWMNASYPSVIEGEVEVGISPTGLAFYRREKERVDRFRTWVGDRLAGLQKLDYQGRVERLKEVIGEFVAQEA